MYRIYLKKKLYDNIDWSIDFKAQSEVETEAGVEDLETAIALCTQISVYDLYLRGK